MYKSLKGTDVGIRFRPVGDVVDVGVVDVDIDDVGGDFIVAVDFIIAVDFIVAVCSVLIIIVVMIITVFVGGDNGGVVNVSMLVVVVGGVVAVVMGDVGGVVGGSVAVVSDVVGREVVCGGVAIVRVPAIIRIQR